MKHRAGIGTAAALALTLACLVPSPLAAQGGVDFSLQGDLGPVFPAPGAAASLGTGIGGGLRLNVGILPLLAPYVRLGFAGLPLSGGGSATTYPLYLADFRLGLGLDFGLGERFTAGLDAAAGAGLGIYPNVGAAPLFSLSAGGYFGFRISPSLEIDLSASYSSGGGYFPGASAGLQARFGLGKGGTAGSRLRAEVKELSPVFPVFHSYYDANPLGRVELRNGEDSVAKDIKVYLSSGQFMAQPKLCATIDSLAPGATAEVPLYALFGDDILSVTATSTLPATVTVEYRLLGSARRSELPIVLELFHRNAMNWVDDRRAAAFVSAMDPSVLWFSRSTASVAGERMRGGISRNLQLAMGLFENERLFGINYVVDPSSSYVENAADESSVDYLQYPSQTLLFRGGDCDDLSILFCSLLQSLGVETAFITIPGHIYAAFRLDLDAAAAAKAFSDKDLLIVRGNEAWVPVEITMVKDGFVKAWRIGAKEWVDNAKTGSANFYPLKDAWRLYPSVGIPGVTSRFALPPEPDLMQAFDSALDRYVVKEIDAQIRAIALDPSRQQTASTENALGIVYGRNGMLKDAWKHFSLSAKGGEQMAWTNLANVAFLRRDYELARDYYAWALKLDPSDDYALLGTARAAYELEHFDSAGEAYSILKARNPGLAAEYSYLGSMFSGAGRAWSLAERMASTPWSDAASRRQLLALRPVAAAPAAAAPASPPAPPAAPVPAPVAPPEAPAPSTPVTAEVAAVPEGPAAAEPEAAPTPQPDTVAEAPAPEAAAPLEAPAAAPPPLPELAPPTVDEGPKPVEDAQLPAAVPVAPEPDKALAAQVPDSSLDAAAALAASINLRAGQPDLTATAPVDKDLEAATLTARKAAEARATEEAAVPAQALPEEPALPPADPPAAPPVALPAAVPAVVPAAPEPAIQVAVLPPESPPVTEPASPPPLPEAPTSPASPVAPASVPAVLPAAEEPAPVVAAPEPQPASNPVAVAEAPSESVAQPVERAEQEALVPPAAEADIPPALSESHNAPEPGPPAAVPQPAVGPPQAAIAMAPADTVLPEASLPSQPVEAAAASLPSPGQTGWRLVASGFKGMVPVIGRWTDRDVLVVHLEPEEYFAKLLVPLPRIEGNYRLGFTARSTGKAWVGFGLHFAAKPLLTHKGYGEGRSYLAWFTSDPVHRPDGGTRLQLYRSERDTYLDLVADVVLPESLFEDNLILITVDPSAGRLVIAVNGIERLAMEGLEDLAAGDYVVFRSLDMSEFGAFGAEQQE